MSVEAELTQPENNVEATETVVETTETVANDVVNNLSSSPAPLFRARRG